MRVAVVGAGVIGLSTTAALRRAGADVVCFEVGAAMSGRSVGSGRIVRLAHREAYLVDKARSAMEIWAQWSAEAGVELIDQVGLVVCGDVDERAAAMEAADAPFSITESDVGLGLPGKALPGPFLVDPAGGVVDAQAVGRVLAGWVGDALVRDEVVRIELIDDGVRVVGSAGTTDVDACVVAAGTGTAALAGPLGFTVEAELYHHLRLSFPLRDPAMRPPSLIVRPDHWRPGISTYQLLAAPGRWAVGAYGPPELQAWEVGREQAMAAQRELLIDYVRDCLDAVEPEPVDQVYCTPIFGVHDGYAVQSMGAVHVVTGDNLFKLAPLIGRELATAALGA